MKRRYSFKLYRRFIFASMPAIICLPVIKGTALKAISAYAEDLALL